MKTRLTGLLAIVFALAPLATPASAQQGNASTTSSPTRTDTRILYHNGPVMGYTPDVYFIWYGCWDMPGCGGANAQANNAIVQHIVTDFVTSVAGTPYLQINAGYPDGGGSAPSGLVFFGGSIVDPYSHGPTLSEADVESVVAGALKNGMLPADPQGIYFVLGSSDVTVEDTVTHLCLTCCDFHRHSVFNGSEFRYAFVGNPARCPTSCAAQFSGQPSPNGNSAADAMASWVAHALNGVLTNPDGTGWYDRYGLENADKCEGTYGQTYTVVNPDGQSAAANIQLGPENFLIQQNWVNGKKGHCAMSYLQ